MCYRLICKVYILGENEIVRILGVLRYHSFSFGQTTGLLGTLILTNFRIGFRSPYDNKVCKCYAYFLFSKICLVNKSAHRRWRFQKACCQKHTTKAHMTKVCHQLRTKMNRLIFVAKLSWIIR